MSIVKIIGKIKEVVRWIFCTDSSYSIFLNSVIVKNDILMLRNLKDFD